MALLFADGFEGHSSITAMLQNSSSSSSSWNTLYQTFGSISLSTTARTTQVTSANSKSLFFGSGAALYQSYVRVPAATEIIAGVGYYKNTSASYVSTTVIGFGGVTNSASGICIGLNASNFLYAAVPGASYGQPTTILGTATKAISSFAWHYIEARAKLGTTTGELEIRLDGEVVLNLININTATGSIANYQSVSLTCASNDSPSCYYDDLYILDTTGATNNTFLGPISVYSLMPTGAGSSTQLTPTGVASNWDAVNDAVADDATTYVATPTTGQKDFYAFEDLPASVNSVSGVIFKTRNTMGTSGSRKLIMSLKNGASVISSGLRNLVFGTWTNDSYVADTAPDGSAWTPAKVNSTEGGVEAG